MTTSNLWGSTIQEKPKKNENTPLGLLNIAGEELARGTKLALKTRIISIGDNDGELEHRYYITVPKLDNYRFLLLTIKQDGRTFPLAVVAQVNTDQYKRDMIYTIDGIDTFKKYLQEILQCNEMRDVIGNLLDMAPK